MLERMGTVTLPADRAEKASRMSAMACFMDMVSRISSPDRMRMTGMSFSSLASAK